MKKHQWHILPSWIKGAVVGGLVGLVILISTTWTVTTTDQKAYAIYIPLILLIVAIALGALISHAKRY